MRYEWGSSPKPKVHLAVALSMALIAAVIAGYLYIDARTTLAKADLIEGIVVDSLVDAGMHTPKIEYSAVDGSKRQFVSRFSSSPQKYFVGDSVVLVIQEGESKPKLKSFITFYGLSAFAGIFSIISFVGAFGVYYLRVRPLEKASKKLHRSP